jgi:hypothetical protein
VTSRRPDFRLFAEFFESRPAGGTANFGEDSSMAAAYALDSVLNAVTDVGSMSALRAVPGLSVVTGDGLI